MATKEKPTFVDTLRRVREELKDKGRSNISLSEAEESAGLAATMLGAAARAEGMEIEVKVNKKSVSAKVVTPE